MQYITLPIALFHSPEYIGAEPTDRATWINLIAYCAEQECGGVIRGCAAWSTRMWEQICGVTRDEVTRECGLWKWNGDSIEVWGYPSFCENKTRAMRERAMAARKYFWSTKAQTSKSADSKISETPQKNLSLEPTPPPARDWIEEIYALYPRKVGRPAAMRAIARAIKKFGAEHVFDSTKKFADAWAGASRDEMYYCPHPATWFNQDRFNDAPETWRPPNADEKKSSNNEAVEIIRAQKELERIEARLKKIKDGATYTAWGPEYNKEELAEIKNLSARRDELIKKLNFAA